MKSIFGFTSRWRNPKGLVTLIFFGMILGFGAQVRAQQAAGKRGSVKGNVSLLNAAQERSAAEGISLELKPLASGASLTVVTDEAGNYEVRDLAAGDYVLQLKGEGFEPFEATLHVKDGAALVQNITAKLTGVTEKVEVKEQVEPVSAAASTTPKFSEKQLESLPLT